MTVWYWVVVEVIRNKFWSPREKEEGAREEDAARTKRQLRQGSCSHDRPDISPVYELILARQIGFPNHSKARAKQTRFKPLLYPLLTMRTWKVI